MPILTPCYGCLERTLGCHSTCKKYSLWKETTDSAKDSAGKNAIIGMKKEFKARFKKYDSGSSYHKKSK